MIDARGYSCPIPVLKTQEEIKKNHPQMLEVLVDNRPAVGNITRFAENNGYCVEVRESEGDEFSLILTKK